MLEWRQKLHGLKKPSLFVIFIWRTCGLCCWRKRSVILISAALLFVWSWLPFANKKPVFLQPPPLPLSAAGPCSFETKVITWSYASCSCVLCDAAPRGQHANEVPAERDGAEVVWSGSWHVHLLSVHRFCSHIHSQAHTQSESESILGRAVTSPLRTVTTFHSVRRLFQGLLLRCSTGAGGWTGL